MSKNLLLNKCINYNKLHSLQKKSHFSPIFSSFRLIGYPLLSHHSKLQYSVSLDYSNTLNQNDLLKQKYIPSEIDQTIEDSINHDLVLSSSFNVGNFLTRLHNSYPTPDKVAEIILRLTEKFIQYHYRPTISECSMLSTYLNNIGIKEHDRIYNNLAYTIAINSSYLCKIKYLYYCAGIQMSEKSSNRMEDNLSEDSSLPPSSQSIRHQGFYSIEESKEGSLVYLLSKIKYFDASYIGIIIKIISVWQDRPTVPIYVLLKSYKEQFIALPKDVYTYALIDLIKRDESVDIVHSFFKKMKENDLITIYSYQQMVSLFIKHGKGDLAEFLINETEKTFSPKEYFSILEKAAYQYISYAYYDYAMSMIARIRTHELYSPDEVEPELENGVFTVLITKHASALQIFLPRFLNTYRSSPCNGSSLRLPYSPSNYGFLMRLYGKAGYDQLLSFMRLLPKNLLNVQPAFITDLIAAYTGMDAQSNGRPQFLFEEMIDHFSIPHYDLRNVENNIRSLNFSSLIYPFDDKLATLLQWMEHANISYSSLVLDAILPYLYWKCNKSLIFQLIEILAQQEQLHTLFHKRLLRFLFKAAIINNEWNLVVLLAESIKLANAGLLPNANINSNNTQSYPNANNGIIIEKNNPIINIIRSVEEIKKIIKNWGQKILPNRYLISDMIQEYESSLMDGVYKDTSIKNVHFLGSRTVDKWNWKTLGDLRSHAQLWKTNRLIFSPSLSKWIFDKIAIPDELSIFKTNFLDKPFP